MKKLATLSFALLMALVLAAPAVAGDAEGVTMEGNLLCGKCTLHEESLEKCQNVLVVTKDGEESHYYLAKNEAGSKYGDVCMKSRMVRVTGQVEEKDGHMWIAATKIENVEKEG